MPTLVVISIVLQTAAVVWSIILWRALRNWRMGILTAFFVIILARRIHVLAVKLEILNAAPDTATEWVSVLITALALLTVVAWHLYVIGHGRAERELSLLASALSASPDGMLITDNHLEEPGPTIVFVNDAFCRMSGYSREELIGKTPMFLHAPTQSRAYLDDLNRELRAGGSFIAELLNRSKEGRDYWVSWSIAPIRDSRGRTTHYLSTGRDITDRKCMDDQLRIADQRYRAIISATGTGYAEIDDRGILLDANDEFARLTGRNTREEVIGKSVVEWTAPHDVERNAAEVRKCADAGHVRGLEVDYVTPRGDIIPIEVSAITIRQNGDSRIISFCRDISERRRADALIRASEERYRRIVETAHEGLWIVDANWTTTFANHRMGEIIGCKPDEMIGRHIFEFMSEDQRAEARENMGRREQGVRESHDFHFTRPDGSSVWTAMSTSPILDDSGKFVGSLAMVSDITERKLAEDRVRASEQRLASMVRHTPLAVILWDANFRIAEWNPAAESIFGWTAAQAIGMHAHLIVPASAHPYVDEILEKLVANKGGTRGTNDNVTRDGRIISCEWYNSPLVGPDGKVYGIVSLCQDVSERTRAEQRQHTLMLELDHRVKNNLAAILALAEQTLYTSESLQQFGEAFTGRLRAMSRMHELLARSRWQSIELSEMVRRSLEAYVMGPKPPITIAGEHRLLSSKTATGLSLVLHELATNAAKYGSLSIPTGHVHVGWSITDSDDASRTLTINWRESDGPPVTPPTRRGFGTGLIEGVVAYEFGGSAEFDFAPTGLCCRIVLPLPESEPAPQTPLNANSTPS